MRASIWKTDEIVNAFAGMALRVAAREVLVYADDMPTAVASLMRQRAKLLHKKANEFVPHYNKLIDDAANEKLEGYMKVLHKKNKWMNVMFRVSERDVKIIQQALNRSVKMANIAKEHKITKERVNQIISRHSRMLRVFRSIEQRELAWHGVVYSDEPDVKEEADT